MLPSDSQLVTRASNIICNLLSFSELQRQFEGIFIFPHSEIIWGFQSNFLYKKIISQWNFDKNWHLYLQPCFLGKDSQSCAGKLALKAERLGRMIGQQEGDIELARESNWDNRVRFFEQQAMGNGL